MTTNPFIAELQGMRRDMQALRPSVVGNILPVLGLGAAFAVLGGTINTATEGGLALTSAGYTLTTSLYGVQDAIARALIPFIETATPIIAKLADGFVALDEATDGWSTKIALAAAAAYPLFRIGAGLVRVLARIGGWLIRIPGLATRAAAAIATVVGSGTAAAAGISAAPLAVVAPAAAAAVAANRPSPHVQTRQDLVREAIEAQGGAPLTRAQSNTINQYTFYLTSYDDNELLRRIQELIDQGAVRGID